MEGYSDVGYVPGTNRKSGVTIGYGFDIGQQSLKTFAAMSFPDALVKKLAPYLGLKGDAARQFLRLHPLKLSRSEMIDLQKGVEDYYYKLASNHFETCSDLTFARLDPRLQTVWCSLYFQYGELRKRCPKFTYAFSNAMWRTAYNELLSFGDAYPTRRKQEAKLIQNYILEREKQDGKNFRRP